MTFTSVMMIWLYRIQSDDTNQSDDSENQIAFNCHLCCTVYFLQNPLSKITELQNIEMLFFHLIQRCKTR